MTIRRKNTRTQVTRLPNVALSFNGSYLSVYSGFGKGYNIARSGIPWQVREKFNSDYERFSFNPDTTKDDDHHSIWPNL